MNIQDAHKRHLDTNFSEWHKSPLSGPPDNQCVEVSFTSNAVGLRDSRNPDGYVLVFDHGEWEAFVGGVAGGSFRLSKSQ
ncbi:hypothetical protein Lesp02_30820 [Lentzea sp. NBRC 105346]|uniref:DUF397 domain-containing protein n=1 Tax=Lentzea sp. NBRC 105346 TaxID=3032205 RepID=UPI0024A53109|nr:DUF397 domain-containing protein [Lentzea sp. NBRC 105346]GLZ30893.1 hypothetical protein Lesp02_30820 [Lentzea sp. NBRC 105346]